MQKRGVPTVTLVTEQFVSLARAAAKSLGYPDIPLVVVPHPFETMPRDQVRALAEQKYDEIVGKVTKTAPRRAPGKPEAAR